MKIVASLSRLVVVGLMLAAGSVYAATSYQVTNYNSAPANGWVTGAGISIQALYLIDPQGAINSASDLNALLGSPTVVGTVSVSGLNPSGPITGTFEESGGANLDGFDTFSKTDTVGEPTSGTIELAAGTAYLGLKDGKGGTLLAVFANALATATTASYLMTWTDILHEPNQALSNFFYGTNTNVLPPAEVPIPAAIWLFGSALLGMVGISRRGALASKA